MKVTKADGTVVENTYDVDGVLVSRKVAIAIVGVPVALLVLALFVFGGLNLIWGGWGDQSALKKPLMKCFPSMGIGARISPRKVGPTARSEAIRSMLAL